MPPSLSKRLLKSQTREIVEYKIIIIQAVVVQYFIGAATKQLVLLQLAVTAVVVEVPTVDGVVEMDYG